jgi:ABC-2 type transport system ATP-binding protein
MVTTHYMDEAELCQRVGFINQGRLIALDTPNQLKETQMRGQVLEVSTPDPDRAMRVLKAAQAGGILPLEEVALYGALVHVVVPAAEEFEGPLAAYLAQQGVEVHGIESIAPTLEDVFISAVRPQ